MKLTQSNIKEFTDSLLKPSRLADESLHNFINVYNENNDIPFKLLEDPTFTGFKIFFHFGSQHGLLANEKYINSALAFFKRIGDNDRYELTKKFINTLSNISIDSNYFFQNISGINEIFPQNFTKQKREGKIDISTLESIDFRISSLIQMFKNIVYDYDRGVYILSENLRQFTMSIYIYDIRIFNTVNNGSEYNFIQTIENREISKVNHILIDLGFCEFDEENSGSSFVDSVSNINMSEQKMNNISIKFQKSKVNSMFKTIIGDNELNSENLSLQEAGVFSKINTLKPSMYDNLNTFKNKVITPEVWINHGRNVGNHLINQKLEKLRGEALRLYLGNVYGLSPNNIIQSINDDSSDTLINRGQQAISNIRTTGLKSYNISEEVFKL